MKGFSQPSFFRVFDLLISLTNPGLKRARWAHDGVNFERDRHTFTAATHGFAIDVFTLTRPGSRGWSLIVAKEYWWLDEAGKSTKSLQWARPTGGQRTEILRWFEAQKASTERAGKGPPKSGGAEQ
jgi:hypothetical protein